MIGGKEKYALVTGASTGIGFELSRHLAKDGKNLVLVDRDKGPLQMAGNKIKEEYGITVKVLLKDLSEPKAPLEIFSELEKEKITVDVLVNNAGFSIFGLFWGTVLQKELEMIQVHNACLIHLTKLFLKNMLDDKSGWILNVASTDAFLPTPLQSVHAASKSFILSFSEALANELKETGVSVTCLCPGPTDTPFWMKGGLEKSKTAKRKKMSASVVAEAGYKALVGRKAVAIPGLRNRWETYLLRILPRNTAIGMVKSRM